MSPYLPPSLPHPTSARSRRQPAAVRLHLSAAASGRGKAAANVPPGAAVAGRGQGRAPGAAAGSRRPAVRLGQSLDCVILGREATKTHWKGEPDMNSELCCVVAGGGARRESSSWTTTG